MLTVTVTGGREADKAAAELKREGIRFQRRVTTAVGKAVKRVYFPTLVGMVPRFMPSGYAPTFAASLKAVPVVRYAGISPGVSVVVSAPTTGRQGRAVNALERGELRAPSFPSGPRNTWKWHRQRIPPGFGSKPLEAIRPQIKREIELELREITRDLET
ncbi:MAG TPA: hypothetical protein VF163_15025 [Micromonosporaceae bacterium]